MLDGGDSSTDIFGVLCEGQLLAVVAFRRRVLAGRWQTSGLYHCILGMAGVISKSQHHKCGGMGQGSPGRVAPRRLHRADSAVQSTPRELSSVEPSLKRGTYLVDNTGDVQ